MADTTRTVVTKRVSLRGSHKGRQRAHNAATGRYERQRLRTTANKSRARKRHLELHPNDIQAKIKLAGLV